MNRRKIIQQAVQKSLERAAIEEATAKVQTPRARDRGVQFYFTAQEWRLLLGWEVNGKAGLRFDFYLGLGPVLVRVTV